MKENTIFFTIVARNYLAQAYALGDSVKKHHAEFNFYIFLIDDVDGNYKAEIIERGFSVIYPEVIPIDNYKQFMFKYDIIEACTGVKPFVIQHLLKNGVQKVIYLDPDTLCFRRFNEVLQYLDSYSIVLTPHSLSPLNDDYFPSDDLFLTHGAYNLGFIGVAKGLVTDQFLQWWSNHSYKSCLNAPELNLFVDQKWIDLVPSFFDGVKILKSLAYNIAYWNLHERTLEKKDGKFYVVQSNEEVAFIHYSGFKITPETSSNVYFNLRKPYKNKKNITPSLADRTDIFEPFEEYRKLLIQNKYFTYSSIDYTFSRYTNGEKISKLERYLFFASSKWQKQSIDPFQVGEDSFWKFCRSFNILTESSYKGNVILKENFSKNFLKKIIRFLIKFMIILMGFENYFVFAAYLTDQFRLSSHDFLLPEEE